MKPILFFLFVIFFVGCIATSKNNPLESSGTEDDAFFEAKIEKYFSLKKELTIIQLEELLTRMNKPRISLPFKNSLMFANTFSHFSVLIVGYLDNAVDINNKNEVNQTLAFLFWLEKLFTADDKETINLFGLKSFKGVGKHPLGKSLEYRSLYDLPDSNHVMKIFQRAEKKVDEYLGNLLGRNIKDDPTLKTCEINRDFAKQCALKYFDKNCDLKIDKKEIEDAREKYPPFWIRWSKILKFMRLFDPIDKVMKRCDLNNDGVIDFNEFYDPRSQCLDTCESLEKLKKYFCDPAEKEFRDDVKNNKTTGNCHVIVNGEIVLPKL